MNPDNCSATVGTLERSGIRGVFTPGEPDLGGLE